MVVCPSFPDIDGLYPPHHTQISLTLRDVPDVHIHDSTHTHPKAPKQT